MEIKRIIDLCKEYGIPEPTWADNHGFISICFFKSKEAFLHNVIKDTKTPLDVSRTMIFRQKDTKEAICVSEMGNVILICDVAE